MSCTSDSRNKSVAVSGIGSLGEAGDAREDLLGGFRPHEWLELLLMHLEKTLGSRAPSRTTHPSAALNVHPSPATVASPRRTGADTRR